MREFLNGYKWLSVLAVFSKFIEAVFELLLPMFMVSLIDNGILKNNREIIMRYGLIMLICVIVGYGFALICQYLASVISQRVAGRIRSQLFDKVMSFNLEDVNSFSETSLTTRMTNDVTQVQEMIAKTIRLAVRAPMIMVGSLVALYRISPSLGRTLLQTIPIFVGIIIIFMYGSMIFHKRTQIQLDALAQTVDESLDGMRIIRAFSKQRDFSKRFRKQHHAVARGQHKVGIMTSLSSPVTTLFMNIVLVVLVYKGSLQISSGAMTQGQLIAVINYCTQLVMTMIVFMNLVMIFARGYASLGRIEAVLNTTPAPLESGVLELVKKPFSLRFDNVDFAYPGNDKNVLEQLSFTVDPGTTLGVIGLTGSGKSTLVQLIPRLYEPRSGTIMLNDMPLDAYDLNSLRSKIGYVSQKSRILSSTIEDNIAMGHGKDASITSLVHAQGKDIVSKGLQSHLQEQGRNLSGGQRQRVNIARELNKKPGLLILDDAMSALDTITTKNLLEILREDYVDATKIIVSQQVRHVKHAEHILILDQGRIVASGTHEYLLEADYRYRMLNNLQEGH